MVNQIFKTLLTVAIKAVVVYSLCLFYSALTSVVLLYKYWTKYETKFWIPKDHSVKPKALSDPEYGEHRFITANGLKFHYVEKGDPTKPLMLFVHGFPEFWYSWRYQLKEFSKDYRAIAVDMRGYGDSDKPSGIGAYAIANMTEDIRCLIEAFGYEKCVLVCHDWGAAIGWSFVSHHMTMVSKYVMMGAPSSDVWREEMNWDQFRKSWYMFFFQMPLLPEFTMKMRDYDVLHAIGKISENFTAEDLEAYKYTFSKPGALTYPLNYYRSNMTVFEPPKPPKLVNFAPGLFILGENDLYISKACGPLLQKRFHNLRFETVANANHFVQQDAPKQTNALIRDFLKE